MKIVVLKITTTATIIINNNNELCFCCIYSSFIWCDMHLSKTNVVAFLTQVWIDIINTYW